MIPKIICTNLNHFNSRPHEEVDHAAYWLPIKAPFIPTHDLTKRSTSSAIRAEIELFIFQLTTSRRGRRFCHNSPGFFFRISTHDLTKRSTSFFNVKYRIAKYFNSRPHEEVDRYTDLYSLCQRDFNSRPHEEVDGKSTQITPYFCSYIWHILPKHTTQLHTTIFIYFFFQQILSKTRCESSTISCLLHARTGRSSFQKIKVSVTSNPGLAPICSTLF